MSMNVKSPGPPFIFGVKKCDPPPGSSKIAGVPGEKPGEFDIASKVT